MADYTITKMEQSTRYREGLTAPEEIYTITFRVGDHGPFKVVVPVEDYTSAKGRDAVQERVNEISSTLGT